MIERILPHFVVNAQIRDWGNPAQAGVSGCLVDGIPTLKCFEVVFGNILFMSSALIILVLFVMIVIGAVKYITSFGNPEQMKKAQGTLRYALIGFGLFIAAYLILKIIDILFLGGQNRIFMFSIPGP